MYCSHCILLFISASASFTSVSEKSSNSRGTSSKESESNHESNEDSDSQVKKPEKVRRSKSRKEKVEEVVKKEDEEEEEHVDNVQTLDAAVDTEEQTVKKKKKGKKSKQKSGDTAEEQNDKKKKQKKGKDKLQSKQETKQSLVVVESSSGTETSIVKLLTTSFKISNRVLLVTEWGDFFVAQDTDTYILSDSCLCDYNTLIQINLSDLDSTKRLDSIDSIVDNIMGFKDSKNVPRNVTIQPNEGKEVSQASGFGEVTTFTGDMEVPMWELIEEMIELMKITAKFDKIRTQAI